MRIHEFHWKSINFNEESMNFNEFQRQYMNLKWNSLSISMNFNKSPWIPFGRRWQINEFQWKSMNLNENPCISMYLHEHNEFLWKSMNFNHRKLMEFNERPFRSEPILWKRLSNSKNTNMKRILRTTKHSHVEWNVKSHVEGTQSAICRFWKKKTTAI
jgi:hypothetical protein